MDRARNSKSLHSLQNILLTPSEPTVTLIILKSEVSDYIPGRPDKEQTSASLPLKNTLFLTQNNNIYRHY